MAINLLGRAKARKTLGFLRRTAESEMKKWAEPFFGTSERRVLVILLVAGKA